MATADRHIGDLNVELTKGQGRSIKLTSLLTNTSTTAITMWPLIGRCRVTTRRGITPRFLSRGGLRLRVIIYA
jgi:hypothetical protein